MTTGKDKLDSISYETIEENKKKKELKKWEVDIRKTGETWRSLAYDRKQWEELSATHQITISIQYWFALEKEGLY